LKDHCCNFSFSQIRSTIPVLCEEEIVYPSFSYTKAETSEVASPTAEVNSVEAAELEVNTIQTSVVNEEEITNCSKIDDVKSVILESNCDNVSAVEILCPAEGDNYICSEAPSEMVGVSEYPSSSADNCVIQVVQSDGQCSVYSADTPNQVYMVVGQSKLVKFLFFMIFHCIALFISRSSS
jgi:hypothetical protein